MLPAIIENTVVGFGLILALGEDFEVLLLCCWSFCVVFLSIFNDLSSPGCFDDFFIFWIVKVHEIVEEEDEF